MALNSIFTGRIKHIHLVGIGGIGMSGIARILLASGFNVSGSDVSENRETTSLRSLGAHVFIGHHAKHMDNADVLVYSSAIPYENAELCAARSRGIPTIPRAVMLAELMRLRCGIAVAGAHGKTTTTSIIGTLMHQLGFDPTVIIGGIVNHFGANAILGQSQFMVAEADESDGTFLHLSPTIAVVTNIDAEHLDYYQGGITEISEHFSNFLETIPFYGLVVACIDDPHVRNILEKLNRRILSYGFSKGATFRAQNIHTHEFSTSFEIVVRNASVYPCRINMVGHHNVLNTLAAVAVMDELGVAPSALFAPLSSFNGVKRRFSIVPSHKDFFVIDDYAHHPTEIRAVLKAARNTFKDRPLHVLFQPHRFSRTKDLMEEFAQSFKDCDALVVTDIYAAQEQPLPGISSKVLIDKIKASSSLSPFHVKTIDEGAKKISELMPQKGVALTLGAGSITLAGPHIVDLLHQKYGLSL
ncbi:MAG: UDP-N-acetylmuramate--L-alanine ligase [Myxococcales bacterium]|nr:UDP-N-acetylmuramate--L-alanine ligase [Myxococcales bacterium]USN51301.1 MAG: UDP-N-acetylmuramate--L-alanine ligase [Myxococcales bacterium]